MIDFAWPTESPMCLRQVTNSASEKAVATQRGWLIYKPHFPRLLPHLRVHMSQCYEPVLLALMLVNKLASEAFKLILTVDNSKAGYWGPTGLFFSHHQATHRLDDGTVQCEHINRKVWLDRKMIILCSLPPCRGITKQHF